MTPTPPTRPQAAASRDPRWDTARWLAGTLVVVGHAIEEIRDLDSMRWLYIATWPLRIPVLALVCGYFSSARVPDARAARRLLTAVAVPYLVFSAAHTVQIRLMGGGWRFFLGETAWGLWFLLALLFWRVALPYAAALRHPLTLSVLAALLVGYFDEFGPVFTASRAVAFFPFFLLGWKIRQGFLSGFLSAPATRLPSAAALLLAMAAVWWLRDDIRLAWLPMRGHYGSESAVFGAEGAWLVRGTLLLYGGVLAVCLIRLVPRRRIPLITALGTGGMYVYLLHIFFVRYARHHGWTDLADRWYEAPVVIAAAVALAVALASPPVRALTRPFVQPGRARPGGTRALPRTGTGRVPRPRQAARGPLSAPSPPPVRLPAPPSAADPRPTARRGP
ncbi:acyltransferase family protein [Streptomyces sp. NPDC049879]|uniref:acyltransferase family protein n=1 Tax=Streptomyces sp. NPDC049879 TaxID=3365598 RepID=UPI0037A67AA8